MSAFKRPTRTIVIVDNDATLRRALERIMSARDYLALGFDSAEDYLAARSGIEADCLVLDIELPGISGLELFARLATTEETPPVIFMTGYAMPHMRAAVNALGAEAYLPKPFNAVELLASIDRACSGRRHRSGHALQARDSA